VTLLSVTRGTLLINLRKYENRARVHFIPNLKVGVFVTLRTPFVINLYQSPDVNSSGDWGIWDFTDHVLVLPTILW
jgi:hypothetical protein